MKLEVRKLESNLKNAQARLAKATVGSSQEEELKEAHKRDLDYIKDSHKLDRQTLQNKNNELANWIKSLETQCEALTESEEHLRLEMEHKDERRQNDNLYIRHAQAQIIDYQDDNKQLDKNFMYKRELY